MAKNITFSMLILVPLVGIGGSIGSSIGAQIRRREATSSVTIQPLEMHRATNIGKLMDRQMSSYF
jgi:hypothetical protein